MAQKCESGAYQPPQDATFAPKELGVPYPDETTSSIYEILQLAGLREADEETESYETEELPDVW
jgi:hypothetical protein